MCGFSSQVRGLGFLAQPGPLPSYLLQLCKVTEKIITRSVVSDVEIDPEIESVVVPTNPENPILPSTQLMDFRYSSSSSEREVHDFEVHSAPGVNISNDSVEDIHLYNVSLSGTISFSTGEEMREEQHGFTVGSWERPKSDERGGDRKLFALDNKDRKEGKKWNGMPLHPRHFIPIKDRLRGKRESRDLRGHLAGEGEEGEEEEEESSALPTAVSRSRGGGRYVSEYNDEIDGTDAGSDRESSEEIVDSTSIMLEPLSSPMLDLLRVTTMIPQDLTDCFRRTVFLLSLNPSAQVTNPEENISEAFLFEIDRFLSNSGVSALDFALNSFRKQRETTKNRMAFLDFLAHVVPLSTRCQVLLINEVC